MAGAWTFIAQMLTLQTLFWQTTASHDYDPKGGETNENTS